MAVGLGDVAFDGRARFNDRGELEVQQTLVNEGKQPVSFRCQVLAPDRCRQASQVIDLRGEPSVQVYRFPHGWDLFGKSLWLARRKSMARGC